MGKLLTILVNLGAGIFLARDGILAGILYYPMFFFTMFGCMQIVGSIQWIHVRRPSQTMMTILIWIGLFALAWYLINRFANQYLFEFFISFAHGFLVSITSGTIT